MAQIYNAGTYTNTSSNPVKINSNLIFGALFNLLISQQVFADNIKGTYSELVDNAKVDGTLYGDTKAYYSTDVLRSRPFLGDAEAANLLSVNRPKAPEVQYISLDVFRQIDITVDNYLSKQAWADEGTFSSFNSVILGWIRETKKVYDTTTYNSFIGTTQSATQGAHSIDVSTATSGLTGLEAKRMEALTIAQDMADLIDDMKDTTRSYNDYGFLRSYNEDDLKIVISTNFANAITKLDLPTVYNKEGVDITKMCKKIPARYFGTLLTSSNLKTYATGTAYSAGDFIYDATGVKVYKVTADIAAASNTALTDVTKTEQVVRAAIEKTYTISTTDDTHVFAGDVLPTGTTIGTSQDMDYGEVYAEDNTKVGVIMHKGSVPYMSAFEVGTSFFNPRSLTDNHYLTFGHNTLAYLKEYPFLVIKKA